MDTSKAKDCLKELAAPRFAGDPIKSAIERAARLAKLSYWRSFDIWYGKARRIEQFEEAQILAALHKKRRSVAGNELAELKSRIARLESLLLRTDEDFHREDIAALRLGNRGTH